MTDRDRRRLWVVEINFEEWEPSRWEATCIVGLDREEAREKKRRDFPRDETGDRTRVRCYVPREENP